MSKGKNFSRNRARLDRIEADFYQTPLCLTDEFVKTHVLNLWPSGSQIADFCCGQCAIQIVLDNHGYKTTFSKDIVTTQCNFFDIFVDPPMGDTAFPYGIMNPPFRLFNKWVEHCYRVFSKEFALLAPTTYLQGIGCFNAQGTGIFQNPDWNLAYIYTFNRYPMLSAELRPDGLIETGMQALSWFVWERAKFPLSVKRVTQHRWLDIDRYVLQKRRYAKGANSL
jgi:hypothetical protein